MGRCIAEWMVRKRIVCMYKHVLTHIYVCMHACTMQTDLEEGEEPHREVHQEPLGDDKAEGVTPPARHQVEVAIEGSGIAVLQEDGVADRGRHPNHGQERVGADPGAGRVAEEEGRGQEKVDGLEPPRHGTCGDAAKVYVCMVWFVGVSDGRAGPGALHY